ncbi:hypothetical protein KI387_014979, partial [Taxus chinensis]
VRNVSILYMRYSTRVRHSETPYKGSVVDMLVAGIDDSLNDVEVGESAVEAMTVVGITGLDVGEVVEVLVDGLVDEGEVL